jgi:hypothetical protein
MPIPRLKLEGPGARALAGLGRLDPEALAGELERLCRLRRQVGSPAPGPRVAHHAEARQALEGVLAAAARTAAWPPAAAGDWPRPHLELTSGLDHLDRATRHLYAFVAPAGLAGLVGSLVAPGAGGAAVWVVRGLAVSLLGLPLSFRRRTRLNLEHAGDYRELAGREGAIVLERLSRVVFQSHLAFGLGLHLFRQRFGAGRPAWQRRGWARLAQWETCRRLAAGPGGEAVLGPVLEQLIGEIKFAGQVAAKGRGGSLPWRLRLARSMYTANPLTRLVAGRPGFRWQSLARHALGTAHFWLESRRLGPEAALALEEEPAWAG